jgi:hypothetical protein
MNESGRVDFASERWGGDEMEDASIEVKLGSVQSLCGKLSFAFIVRNSGDAHLQIYGSDPSDGRKAGILLTLNEGEYQKLKEMIEKTDRTIERLRDAGQMRTMLASLR